MKKEYKIYFTKNISYEYITIEKKEYEKIKNVLSSQSYPGSQTNAWIEIAETEEEGGSTLFIKISQISFILSM